VFARGHISLLPLVYLSLLPLVTFPCLLPSSPLVSLFLSFPAFTWSPYPSPSPPPPGLPIPLLPLLPLALLSPSDLLCLLSPYPCLFYPLSLLPFLPLISPTFLPFLSSSCLSHPLPHPPPCFLPFADEPAISTVTSNRLTPNDFEVVKVIGRGAFGEVQLVSHYIHHL